MSDLLAQADGPNGAAIRLKEKLQTADWQTIDYIHGTRRDWSDLQLAIELLSTERSSEAKALEAPNRRDASRHTFAITPNGLPNDLFPAQYTTGEPFDTWKASLPGLGGISDTNGDGSLADERCDTNFEAGVEIAAAVFNITNTTLDIGCHAAPELVDIACFAAQAIVALAAEANATVAAQCSLVDGAVDAVELEATFENVNAIWGNLDAHHGTLESHDLSLTNHNTSLTNHDAKLTNHDTNLTAHNALIVNLVNQHDIEIKSIVAQHDAEIKALLANLQGGVDANAQALKVAQARQAQVFRLLLTPEGQRMIDPALLTCTGDDCPAVLDCPGAECAFPVR